MDTRIQGRSSTVPDPAQSSSSASNASEQQGLAHDVSSPTQQQQRRDGRTVKEEEQRGVEPSPVRLREPVRRLLDEGADPFEQDPILG